MRNSGREAISRVLKGIKRRYQTPGQSPQVPKAPGFDPKIHMPSHYVEGRSIEPITVMHSYGLCHHLSCAVKYIARAGRKHSYGNDLQKALWYLRWELDHYQGGKPPCGSQYLESAPYGINEIVEDWKLGPHLATALSYILASQLKPRPVKRLGWIRGLDRKGHIQAAIRHLQAALESYEGRRRA